MDTDHHTADTCYCWRRPENIHRLSEKHVRYDERSAGSVVSELHGSVISYCTDFVTMELSIVKSCTSWQSVQQASVVEYEVVSYLANR